MILAPIIYFSHSSESASLGPGTAGRRPSVKVGRRRLIVNRQTYDTKRAGVGFANRGPGFYVWEETRLEAELRMKQCDRRAYGSIAAEIVDLTRLRYLEALERLVDPADEPGGTR